MQLVPVLLNYVLFFQSTELNKLLRINYIMCTVIAFISLREGSSSFKLHMYASSYICMSKVRRYSPEICAPLC